MLYPLQRLIRLSEDEKTTQEVLSSFSCSKDQDIETFLKEKAIPFEQNGKSRTYIFLDEDQMIRTPPSSWQVLGYYTVAQKILVLPEEMSIRTRKHLDGFRGKYHGKPVKELPCYLIGQLGRSDNINAEILPGEYLVRGAEEAILKAIEYVGGRTILVECKEGNDKLLSFYTSQGYELWGNSKGYDQLLKVITNN